MLKNLLSFLHEQFKALYTLLAETRILHSAAQQKHTDLLSNVAKIFITLLFDCQHSNQPRRLSLGRTVVL